MKITILGNGAFGSAMASYLSSIGHEIYIDAVKDSEIIFVCVPSFAVIKALSEVEEGIRNQKIVICSKGFAGEGKLLSQALKEKFQNDFFFLYGPVLAEELKNKKFSGMVLSGEVGKEKIKREIESESLHIETSDDVIGSEVSAALKNAMTILIGIVEGAGFGQNTSAYIFSKALEEIKKIGLALGGKTDTFLGLACVGDLTLLSRNRRLGIELGKGRKLEEIIKEMNHNPEGLSALKNAKIIVERLKIDAPLIKLLYSIIFEDYPIKDIFKVIR